MRKILLGFLVAFTLWAVPVYASGTKKSDYHGPPIIGDAPSHTHIFAEELPLMRQNNVPVQYMQAAPVSIGDVPSHTHIFADDLAIIRQNNVRAKYMQVASSSMALAAVVVILWSFFLVAGLFIKINYFRELHQKVEVVESK